MENYNYFENVKEDVKNYILENYTKEELAEGIDEGELYDNAFLSDSVTGNASGSYTFNTWQAEENIAYNMDILADAMAEFCESVGDAIEKGAEFCDVSIRCYVLGQVIGEAIEEAQEEAEDNGEEQGETWKTLKNI